MRQLLKRWFELAVMIILVIFLGWLVSYQGGPDLASYTTAEVSRQNLIKSVSLIGEVQKDNDDLLFLVGMLPEKDYLDVDENDEVKVEFDALADEEFSGKIRSLSEDPIVRVNTTDYRAEFEVDDMPEDILTGMHAEVRIIIDRKDDRLALPNVAIKKDGEKYFVDQIVVERKLHISKLNIERTKESISKVQIEIGFEGDDYTEITGGLKLGDRVISSTFE